MKPFLMGAETEYAVSGQRAGEPLPTGTVCAHLNDALRRERLWLEDSASANGMYLENGARFYLDSGFHPEYATPECHTPFQIACHDKAGERLLNLARQRAMEETPDLSITVLKNNLIPTAPEEATWGTHESYTSWVDAPAAATALLPHLVSRIIYAGSGCLSTYGGCNGFELSQRARYLVRPVGTDTTNDRALFCTRTRGLKDRSEQRGWVRAHLIGKDSQRAPLGVYLTHGTTGLLFLLLNAGLRVGRGLELANPIPALRAISSDPWLRLTVPLANGQRLTALQIQQCYLEDCEREVRRGDFPDWASEVIQHWKNTLELLDRDPLLLANRLDPYCKLLIFDHELRRANCTWIELRDALRDLTALRTTDIHDRAYEVGASTEATVDQAAARAKLSLERRERLRLAVRLAALDVQYHQLGDGLYDRLADAGRMQPFLHPGDVDNATQEAPPGSRAGVRGRCVQEFRDTGWICEWRFLYHRPSQVFVDLRDPFSNRRETDYLQHVAAAHVADPEMREICSMLMRK